MIGHYDWAGGREAMLRFGPADGPVVVAVLPLFEEANRTRAFTVTILRALAARGISGALPDLPGTGESLVPLEAATLADWRAAFATAVTSLGRPAHTLSIRGGALVESEAELAGRWQLTPVTGEELVRELFRARAIAEPGVASDFDQLARSAKGPPVELAGNRISRTLLAELLVAEPRQGGTTRVVRLGKDRRIANRAFDDAPPWRRAEPDNDIVLAQKLADDIIEWLRTCAG
jgi:hypothetical protein